MQIEYITVLCLRNNWNGGYQCFDVFYQDIYDSLEKMNIKYFVADSYEEAENILKNNNVSFSICIGKYCFVKDGIPLYDKYRIVNYEWIIDNPFKYSENLNTPYNRLVMIDDEFKLMPGFQRKDYPAFSLGIPEKQYDVKKYRKKAVLVPWKIKQRAFLERLIYESPMKNQIFDFIGGYDYDSSYIQYIVKYLNENEVDDDRIFFRLTNDYIRFIKRITMINSIKEYAVVIASDEKNDDINGSNVSYVPKGNFKTTLTLQKEYKYVLNNNPNYDMCIHDRVGHAVANGAIVVSDKSTLLKNLSFPLTVEFSKFRELDRILMECDNSKIDYALLQRECLKNYRMNITLEKMIQHYLKYRDYDLED